MIDSNIESTCDSDTDTSDSNSNSNSCKNNTPSRIERSTRSRRCLKEVEESSSDETASDYTDDEEGTKRKSKSRRANLKKVSYKEQSDHTDSDDLVEVDWSNYDAEADNGETIEKILDQRMGKVGATGIATAPYQVEIDGDPNDENATEKELQFLVKWKNWSHLHNTWETEETLKQMKAKGIKKVENFIRREEEIKQW